MCEKSRPSRAAKHSAARRSAICAVVVVTAGALSGAPAVVSPMVVAAAAGAVPGTRDLGVRVVVRNSLASGRIGDSYRVNTKPHGAAVRPRARFTRGQLPPGLTLRRKTGAITGVPTSSGMFNFRVSFAMKGALRKAFRYRLSVLAQKGSARTFCGTASTAPQWEHVVWVLLENKSASAVYGNSNAPYYNSVASMCGVSTNMSAVTYPSLPNYIALTSGSTQGIVDGGAPAAHPLNVPSIFSQLGVGGWKALNESMPSNCYLSDSGNYAVRHNPAAYYTNITAQCATQDIPLALDATPDISAKFTFITPNLINDMHDSDVATGDAWLAGFIPWLASTPEWQSGATAVFVTFDENDRSPGNGIVTLVMSPSTPVGLVSSTAYTHYSVLRTTEEMLGLGLLGNATSAPSMRSEFRLGPLLSDILNDHVGVT